MLAPLIAGEALPEVSLEDQRYLIDIGLLRIDTGGGLIVANPTYHEVILRHLASSSRASLPHIAPTWLTPDGRLDADKLLDAFLEFWRELHGPPGLCPGWLIIFDQRANLPPIEERTRCETVTSPGGRTITIIYA